MNHADLMVVTETERAKILRDRTRSNILNILSEKPLTIKQLSAKLNKTPPTILHHIRKLHQHGFIELKETKKVRNYVEKYYESTIPKSTEILIAAPVRLSKRKLKELRSKPQFFKGKKLWVAEEGWENCADHFLSKLRMMDLSEENQRDILRIILELLDLAALRIEVILQKLLQEFEKYSPRTTRRIEQRLHKYSSAIATYAIDSDEFLEKLRALFQASRSC